MERQMKKEKSRRDTALLILLIMPAAAAFLSLLLGRLPISVRECFGILFGLQFLVFFFKIFRMSAFIANSPLVLGCLLIRCVI